MNIYCELFKISLSTIYRWLLCKAQTGNVKPFRREYAYKKIDDNLLLNYYTSQLKSIKTGDEVSVTVKRRYKTLRKNFIEEITFDSNSCISPPPFPKSGDRLHVVMRYLSSLNLYTDYYETVVINDSIDGDAFLEMPVKGWAGKYFPKDDLEKIVEAIFSHKID